VAEPLDPGLHGGEAFAGRGMQELRLLVEVGGGFDPEVAVGQPAGDKLQGSQQLFECQRSERAVNTAQLGVEGQRAEA